MSAAGEHRGDQRQEVSFGDTVGRIVVRVGVGVAWEPPRGAAISTMAEVKTDIYQVRLLM